MWTTRTVEDSEVSERVNIELLLPDVGDSQGQEGESSVENYLVPPVGKLHVNFIFCQIRHHQAWSSILQSQGLHSRNN